MSLLDAKIGEEYIVRNILTDDEALKSFLFSLGCYSGEAVTVLLHQRGNCVVSVKEGRYSIDNELAQAVLI